jgi:hypothetical protein
MVKKILLQAGLFSCDFDVPLKEIGLFVSYIGPSRRCRRLESKSRQFRIKKYTSFKVAIHITADSPLVTALVGDDVKAFV